MRAIEIYAFGWAFTFVWEMIQTLRERLLADMWATGVASLTPEEEAQLDHVKMKAMLIFVVTVMSSALGGIWPLWWGYKIHKLFRRPTK